MGTRSTYRIIEETLDGEKTFNQELCLIYCQYDGYPHGHPDSVATWLGNAKVVNGISLSERETQTVFNGAGCLAAQLIARLKGPGPGGFYVYPLSSRGRAGEDYLYDIVVKSDRTIEFICYSASGAVLFQGPPKDFHFVASDFSWAQ